MKFRLVARIYFEREPERKLVPPEYNNCPTECLNSNRYYDPNRSKFCADCPNKIERDSFKEQSEQTVSEIMGNVTFDFNNTVSYFYTIRGLEEISGEKISVYSGAFLNVYLSEKMRYERIKDS